MFTGVRKAAEPLADQILRVPSFRAGLFRSAQVLAADRRRGVRHPHRDHVAVHDHRQRTRVPRLVGVAPREPDSDGRRQAAGRDPDRGRYPSAD